MSDKAQCAMDELLESIGRAGRRLAEINACEGAAGNLSIFTADPLDPGDYFPDSETIPLLRPFPELAGGTFLVSGSGTRLRELLDAPRANLGCLRVLPGGETARLFTSQERQFERLTSEFNSHLAVHHDRIVRAEVRFQAVVHAQPPHLTYLSHIGEYQKETMLNRRLVRWQPEMILQFPQGIGVVPFEIPGSEKLMTATVAAMQRRSLVVWCKHGVVARSDTSIAQAVDRIEYAEAAARYEFFNRVAGEPAGGLSEAELLEICAAYEIEQTVF